MHFCRLAELILLDQVFENVSALLLQLFLCISLESKSLKSNLE